MEHWYLREQSLLKGKPEICNYHCNHSYSPSLSKLVSLPVLARLAGDQLVKVLHILVNLHLLSSKGAEQQLETIVRLKSDKTNC